MPEIRGASPDAPSLPIKLRNKDVGRLGSRLAYHGGDMYGLIALNILEPETADVRVDVREEAIQP